MFSRKITAECKGVAVLMLLAHHLWFYPNPELYSNELNHFALRCKLCVAIFLFLSGFGLAKAGCDWRRIFVRRIPKLLLNFWFVATVFLVIGVVLFGMSVRASYPDGDLWRFGLQLFGLDLIAPWKGVMPTWWFMSAIVPLYILAPLLDWLVVRYAALVIACAYVVTLLPAHVLVWIPPFCLGLLFAHTNAFQKIGGIWQLLVLGVLFVLGFYYRPDSCVADGFIASILVSFIYCLSEMLYRTLFWRALGGGLEFLGIHSMNIFLCHTFLRRYWFGGFFDGHCPFVTFMVLLLASLGCSIVIEWMKRILRFNQAVDKFCLRSIDLMRSKC